MMGAIADCPGSIWRLEEWSPVCQAWLDISEHSNEAAAVEQIARRRDVDNGPAWLSRSHRLEDARARYRVVRFDAAAVEVYEPSADVRALIGWGQR